MLHTLNLAYGIHWPSKVFLQDTETDRDRTGWTTSKTRQDLTSMRHKWQQGTDKGGDRLSDHQWAALVCETINQTDSESPSVFQMRLAQNVLY